MKRSRAKTAAALLELLATAAVGELVFDLADDELRRTYAKLMGRCVHIRDSAAADEGERQG